MKQKHYMDIQYIRKTDTEFVQKNIGGFELGDEVVIQEKVDGSNVCAAYDAETGKMVAFSGKYELGFGNSLNGFWEYTQKLNSDEYKNEANYRYFGEWVVKNKIVYRQECVRHWYVFDVYDTDKKRWLLQKEVKSLCEKHNLEYVHTFYVGPFQGWDHVKQFMDDSAYGDQQEGVIIKNQTKLGDAENRLPAVLKIVNADFKERTSPRMKRPVDPEEEKQKEYAMELVKSVVTEARVRKQIFALRDEGILPETLSPEDMKTVARNLPARVYQDCVKEEPETVSAAGGYFSKMCAGVTMQLARKMILGGEEK